MIPSRLRKDPVTQRWVVISPDRAHLPRSPLPPRPAGLAADRCPFCPGHEGETGPEIHADREPGSISNGPGWLLRVVPDRSPVFRIEGGLERSAEGMYDSMNAVGAHEVCIESPHHQRHLADFDVSELERALRAVQQRSLDLRNDSRFRHLIWVRNYGLPGSMFHHPHSHLMASAFIPRAIEVELKGFAEYMRWKERCVLCDVVSQEHLDGRRVVLREGRITAFSPFAACFPYEFWVVPVDHAHDFGLAAPGTLRELARALRACLGGLRRVLEDPPFTLALHTSPLGEFARDEYHWHVEVIPHPPHLLGPEWGTGILINPVAPEDAAAQLRAGIP